VKTVDQCLGTDGENPCDWVNADMNFDNIFQVRWLLLLG
jgi:hypothetical protein